MFRFLASLCKFPNNWKGIKGRISPTSFSFTAFLPLYRSLFSNLCGALEISKQVSWVSQHIFCRGRGSPSILKSTGERRLHDFQGWVIKSMLCLFCFSSQREGLAASHWLEEPPHQRMSLNIYKLKPTVINKVPALTGLPVASDCPESWACGRGVLCSGDAE